MEPEELNRIFLHAVPSSWEKQSYLQGWEFKGSTYKETCNMFDHMEVADQLYEGGKYYKTTNHRADANPTIHGSKYKGGESASPANPDKGRAVKSKKNNAGHPSDWTTSKNHYCCTDPGNPRKIARSSINNMINMPPRGRKNKPAPAKKSRRGKSAKFNKKVLETNIMETQATSIIKRKKVG